MQAHFKLIVICQLPGNNSSTQVSQCSAIKIVVILLEQRFLTAKAQVNLQKSLSNVSMQREKALSLRSSPKFYYRHLIVNFPSTVLRNICILDT